MYMHTRQMMSLHLNWIQNKQNACKVKETRCGGFLSKEKNP